MVTRLLASLCLLAFPQLLPAQQSTTTMKQAPETCPVKKSSNYPFVPPSPYRAWSADSTVFWYGTDRFWTFLPKDGIWPMGEKTFWFRQEWARYKDHDRWIPDNDAAKLKVSARRLDGPASPPQILKANSSFRDQDWKAFLVGGINFSTPGCWQVSAQYESDELTFVVWAVK